MPPACGCHRSRSGIGRERERDSDNSWQRPGGAAGPAAPRALNTASRSVLTAAWGGGTVMILATRVQRPRRREARRRNMKPDNGDTQVCYLPISGGQSPRRAPVALASSCSRPCGTPAPRVWTGPVACPNRCKMAEATGSRHRD